MNNYVITIARGYGSGGHTIGEELADKLGIPCYDRELLERASKASGVSEALFEEANEKIPTFLMKFKKGVYSGASSTSENSDFVSNEGLFNYQSKILRQMAMTESFVIIGRAADYVLRTFPNVISINIQAPEDVCVNQIMRKYNMSLAEATDAVHKIDKYRSDYYTYYTGQKWNLPTNYDLTINTDKIGRGRTADMIIEFAEFKLGRKLR